MTKGISSVIATVMLLMTTVSLIGVFYVFSSTLATQTTSSGGQQASQLTAQLSMCMQIDNIIGNQITLRNCGKGIIENKSLVVMMDDIVLGANTNTINEGNSSIMNISGLWQVPFGKHSLKISNGAAVALALVEIIPNPDGLAGSWNFDEGSGGKAYDASGNGNAGTLTNMNITGNTTSGWTSGRFGNGLLFDGTNDYVDITNQNGLYSPVEVTVEAWAKTATSNIAQKDVYSRGESYALVTDSAIKFGVRNTSSSFVWAASSFTPVINQWYHIVGVYNGSYIKIYVNGGFIAQAYLGGNIRDISSDRNYYAGAKYAWHTGDVYYNEYFFNGTIDEVRIWSKAFSPDETVVIKQII